MNSRKSYNSPSDAEGFGLEGEASPNLIFINTIRTLPKRLGASNALELEQAIFNISTQYRNLSINKLYEGVKKVERSLLSKRVREIKKAEVSFEPKYSREIQIMHNSDDGIEREGYIDLYHKIREESDPIVFY